MKMKLYFVAIFISLGIIAFGQVKGRAELMETECDNRVFTKSEISPALKIPVTTYQDSLNKYLQERNQFPKTGKTSFDLLISKQGEIIDVQIKKSDVDKIEDFVAAIKSFRGQWYPAKQNTYVVCAFKEIAVEFRGDKFVFIKF